MSKAKPPGPRSIAGKEISSINAFKHGLTAQKWTSPELGEYFEKVLRSITKEYLPQTPTEILLVERVATTITKIRRLNNIEDAQYQLARQLIAQKLQDPGAHYDPTLLKNTQSNSARNLEIVELHQAASMPSLNIMNLVNRQQNSLSRQLSKELSELITVVGLRKTDAIKDRDAQIEGPDESDWDFE